jgi:DNA-binding PadR family transcriptional regulator
MSAVYVVIAIGPKELHGYAIMSEIARITDGSVRLGPGTLYTSIKRLLESGLIEETSERPDPELDDHRRRYYRLTPAGRAVATAEVQRLRALVASAGSWA